MNILQNLHFTDNQTSDKSEKACKISIIMNHLNKAFKDAKTDAERQSIEEHITKFKGRLSCKQYIKNKLTKRDFKWCCRCCSKTGCLYEFDLFLGKKGENRAWARGKDFLDLSKTLENTSGLLFQYYNIGGEVFRYENILSWYSSK